MKEQLLDKMWLMYQEACASNDGNPPNYFAMHPETAQGLKWELSAKSSYIPERVNTFAGVEILKTHDLPPGEIKVMKVLI